MSGCEKCHGTGTIPCPTCDGKKTEPCKKCKGTGSVSCSHCDGDGEVTCDECYGTGKEVCPVCYRGKVKKTRWINCAACHGKGEYYDDYYKEWRSCSRCNGRGQVEETYYEICPNCHGDYANYSKEDCPECDGEGTLICGTCHGRKTLECSDCKGTGHVACSHCKGTGSERCPDCEKREREAKERRERKEREERNRRIEAQEKKEAAEKAAKERKELVLGCGCWLVIIAVVSFLIWWWLEGFTMSALPSMWEQSKNFIGGSGGVAKIVAGLVMLLLCWKMISAIKRKRSGSDVSTSSKKRWKFVVLGILLGFFGAHLAYAKRWFLFLLLWTGFIAGNTMGGSKSDPEKIPSETTVQQVEQTDKLKTNDTSPISSFGFGIWALLWIGGTLFIKKDGKGNRM